MEARFGFHSLGSLRAHHKPCLPFKVCFRSGFVSVQTGLILWNTRGLGYSRRVRFFSPPEKHHSYLARFPMTSQISPQSRWQGCLVGLAVGDALGTTVEFKPPGSFEPITDIVGGGPFRLKAGQWTDDTSMALCLAESLVETRTFDPLDQMHRYIRWWRHGHLSSTGHCFDIGSTTRDSLSRFQITGDPMAGTTDANAAGNGSLMRLAPVVMAFANDPLEAIYYAGESSKTTHGAQTAVDACRYFAGLLFGALHGHEKSQLLFPGYCPESGYWEQEPLCMEIDEVARGSFLRKDPPEIRGTGFVVKSLEAALWAFSRSDSFQEGCLLAANLGDDADTTAAIYGQIAGAYYGLEGIPKSWRDTLHLLYKITDLADLCLGLCQPSSAGD